MTELKATFTFERETKNTIRFSEVETADIGSPYIGTLYIRKDALKLLGVSPAAPADLVVTITLAA